MLQLNAMVWVCEVAFGVEPWLSVCIGEGRVQRRLRIPGLEHTVRLTYIIATTSALMLRIRESAHAILPRR